MRPSYPEDPVCVRVFASGELDIATVPALDAAMRRAEREAERIVLDLSELEFLDTTGAHLLLDAHRRIRGDGGELLVAGAPEMVRWTLALLGVDRELELVDELVVRVRETIDLATVIALWRTLTTLDASGHARVALDLRATRPPEAVGMQLLCGLLRELSRRGLTITVVEPDPYLRRMVELHDIERVVCSSTLPARAAADDSEAGIRPTDEYTPRRAPRTARSATVGRRRPGGPHTRIAEGAPSAS